MSRHPPPPASADVFREGAAEGEAGDECACELQQRSLPNTIIFITPGGRYLYFVGKEAGTGSFLCDAFVIVFKPQQHGAEHTGCSPFLSDVQVNTEVHEPPDLTTFPAMQ